MQGCCRSGGMGEAGGARLAQEVTGDPTASPPDQRGPGDTACETPAGPKEPAHAHVSRGDPRPQGCPGSPTHSPQHSAAELVLFGEGVVTEWLHRYVSH